MTDINDTTPHDDLDLDRFGLDEEARKSRLVVHLARLVQRGAKVEEQERFRAVVVVSKPTPSWVPNVVIAAIGVALFIWVGGPFFLLGAGMALLGWHRKLVAGAERVRLLVRVDPHGDVSEIEMGAA